MVQDVCLITSPSTVAVLLRKPASAKKSDDSSYDDQDSDRRKVLQQEYKCIVILEWDLQPVHFVVTWNVFLRVTFILVVCHFCLWEPR
jgi:hypothetical protein